MVYQDLRGKSYEEKVKVYEQIDQLYLKGEHPEVKEHRSGFPAVTVNCGDIHILTDCLSLQQWYAEIGKRARDVSREGR